jgi:hypothetical protein
LYNPFGTAWPKKGVGGVYMKCKNLIFRHVMSTFLIAVLIAGSINLSATAANDVKLDQTHIVNISEGRCGCGLEILWITKSFSPIDAEYGVGFFIDYSFFDAQQLMTLEEEAEYLLYNNVIPLFERFQSEALEQGGFGYIHYAYRATWVHSTTYLSVHDRMENQPRYYLYAPHYRAHIPLTIFERSGVECITHVFELTFGP